MLYYAACKRKNRKEPPARFLPTLNELGSLARFFMIELINGDSNTEIYEVAKKVGDRPCVIVTDPPFNIGYHYDNYIDKMGDSDYYEMLNQIFHVFPAFVVIHYPEAIYRIAFQTGMFPDRVVSWVYNSNTPRQHRDIAYFNVEPSFEGLGEYKNPTDKRIAARIAEGKKAKGYDWIYCDQIKNVSEEKTEHPCQMPLEVMMYILRTIPEDRLICDPFMGSGTTLLAAKILGRDAIGIELSKEYFNIAKQRISNDMPLFANS